MTQQSKLTKSLSVLLLLTLTTPAHSKIIAVGTPAECSRILSSRSGKSFDQTLRFPKDLNGFPKNTDSLIERMHKLNLPELNQSLPQFPHTPPSEGYPNGDVTFDPFQTPVLPGYLATDFNLRVPTDEFVVPTEDPKTLFYTWVPGLK
jgi:hypothetical protein